MKTRFLRHALVAAVFGFIGFMPKAFATTNSENFNVNATVTAACSIDTSDLDFGTYDPTNPANGAQTTIDVTCTPGTTYTLGLSAGLFGTISARQMEDTSSDRLYYQMTSDPAGTTNWDDLGGVHPVTGTADGNADPLTVYGGIPSGQYVPAGSYSDTITATISY